MGGRKVAAALAAALVIVLIVVAIAWIRSRRPSAVTQPDGGVAIFPCSASQGIEIVSAAYAPPGGAPGGAPGNSSGAPVDVTARAQALLSELRGSAAYHVSAAALGQPAGGALTVRYRCTGSPKAGFRGGRGGEIERLAGRLEAQERPGAAPASSLMAAVARRAPPAGAGAPAGRAPVDYDTDFYVDGVYEDTVLQAAAREGLTSRRGAAPNALTASRAGLGSRRRDPRFEPGPPGQAPGSDAPWAHGGHAGGPTLGGLAPRAHGRLIPGAAI